MKVLGPSFTCCLILWQQLLLESFGFAFIVPTSNVLTNKKATFRSCSQAAPITGPTVVEGEPADHKIDASNDIDYFATAVEEEKPRTISPPDFTVVDDDDPPLTASAAIKTPPPPSRDANSSYDETEKPRRRTRVVKRSSPTNMEGTSWMQKNQEFTGPLQDSSTDQAQPQQREPSKRRQNLNEFRGTRVFVQHIPSHVSWQDLKDHFRIAGEVVFASISIDPRTGESKGCGVVQYETTEMAQSAIRIMRDHPMDGVQLYVREDVQEQSSPATNKRKGPTPPSKWKCADEDNASYLSEEELKTIRSLIKARDFARRRNQYDAADNMREELKFTHGVHLDDRLKMWWTSMDGSHVPQSIRDIKGEGRWNVKAWRQIPTTPENDACVNPELVEGLLKQRDIARREKDFATADMLLEQARTSPDGELTLRIHDESRTWRIWTDLPPPRPVQHNRNDPAAQCLELVQEFDPDKVDEILEVLKKFPGREYNILKKLKQRYLSPERS